MILLRPTLPLLLATALAMGTPAAQIDLEPGPLVWITENGQKIDAVRGLVEVPEDRSSPSSRTLQLAYVRLPSTAPRPGPPIVYLAGGPGDSGIDSARGPRAKLLLALRKVADVVLLDQRGTGLSRPALICGKAWEHELDKPLDEAAARASIRLAAQECAAQMQGLGARLGAYNLREIADDVDALRQALAAEKISLVATSYGTRVALETLRRHGARVDRAVLLGVVGPGQELSLPAAADGVLGRIEIGTGSTLRGALRSRLEDLARRPVSTTASNVLTGEKVPITVGPLDLQLAITERLGSADQLLALREIAIRLERGDWEPLAWSFLRQRKRWLGPVMPYAVVCTTGASEARRREVAEQAVSSVVGRQLDGVAPDICDALGVESLDDSLRRSVESDVPVLAVSGTLDARTPVQNANEVLRHLRHGVHIVVEGAGHGEDLWVSTPKIAARAAAFLRHRKIASERLQVEPLEQWGPRSPGQ
jgi:pimeloyl-ACP methyl ester carboxylesterase